MNYPLDRVETAIQWLKEHGNHKFAIMGMSTVGMQALAAAAYIPDITLTFGLTASDFVWQGFEKGKKATLIFDGAMSHARVYVNGQEAGYWPYGYNSWQTDSDRCG